MNGRDSNAEIFDVFLCHNSEDKPAVREISKKLAEKNIKPFLDEADIRPADSWHSIIGKQIETVKAAAVFFGSHGVSRWQSREIIALLNQSDKRGCPVIPVILTSDTKPVVVPWSLEGLHWVDFRATDSQPLKRLIWGITGQKPMELADVPTSEKPTTIREVVNSRLIAGRDQQAVSGDTIPETRIYPPLAEPPDQKQATQLEILRRRVKEYWVDGALKHSLYNEVLISLGKRQADEFVDAPWKYRVEVSDAIASGPLVDRNINAIFDATGLLLILGEPGSGKTTTLLDLARTLLDRSGDDIKERVAVVLNLSSWKKKQPLAEWISDELSEKYRVPRKIALFWLQRGYLLPLLDGLDEVETTLQPDCVAAVHAFIERFNPSGLVVCCRLNEYRWLPERLKLNGAICLEPLSKAEVDDFLDHCGPKLAALRDTVNTDPVLQELTQTPLMLTIMSLAYQGVGADRLSTEKEDSVRERRKQIFCLYVEQMFQRKGTVSHVFPKEKTISWLSWLARKMDEHSQSVFLVEGLQPNWLSTEDKLVEYRFKLALSLGLIVGLTWGLSLWLIYGLIVGLIVGLISGIAGWISEFVHAISTIGRKFVPIGDETLTLVTEWDQFFQRPIAVSIYGLIVVGLIVGLISGLRGGLSYGLIYALSVGLIYALSVGLITGLIGGFTDRVSAGKASLNQGIKMSLKNSLAVFLVTWLIVGLISGLIYGLRDGLSIGLSIGLIAGTHRGGSAVIKHYALRLIFWLKGYTPLKFIKFLDHCARLILLKKVGGGYIFIHRMLLEYFADIPTQHTSVKR